MLRTSSLTVYRGLAVVFVVSLVGSSLLAWPTPGANAADPEVERQVEALVKQRMEQLAEQLQRQGIPSDTIRAITHQAEFELNYAVGKELETGGTPNEVIGRATQQPGYRDAQVVKNPSQWAQENGHPTKDEPPADAAANTTSSSSTGATTSTTSSLPSPNASGYSNDADCMNDLVVNKGYSWQEAQAACNQILRPPVAQPAQPPSSPASTSSTSAGSGQTDASAPADTEEFRKACAIVAAMVFAEKESGKSWPEIQAALDPTSVQLLTVCGSAVLAGAMEPIAPEKPATDPNCPPKTNSEMPPLVAETAWSDDPSPLWASVAPSISIGDAAMEIQSFWNDALASVASCCGMPAPKDDKKDNKKDDKKDSKKDSKKDGKKNKNDNDDDDDDEEDDKSTSPSQPVVIVQPPASNPCGQ